MVKFAHLLMGKPNAKELIMISVAVVLAQNFSELRSLTTTGIQQVHMKMHLLNILNQLEAAVEDEAMIVKYFIKIHRIMLRWLLLLKEFVAEKS